MFISNKNTITLDNGDRNEAIEIECEISNSLTKKFSKQSVQFECKFRLQSYFPSFVMFLQHF